MVFPKVPSTSRLRICIMLTLCLISRLLSGSSSKIKSVSWAKFHSDKDPLELASRQAIDVAVFRVGQFQIVQSFSDFFPIFWSQSSSTVGKSSKTDQFFHRQFGLVIDFLL